MSATTIIDRPIETNDGTDRLTETLEEKLSHPASSPDFDLHAATSEVLKDIGLTAADAGGKLTFYGRDPILPSPIRFGTLAAVGWVARSVAVGAPWRQATGQGQDISVDVRKALRRFAGFFEGKWETVNGRPPSPGGYAVSPFLKLGDAFFRETRDGRHVVALDIYPQLLVRTLDFLRCSPSTESINDAILKSAAIEGEDDQRGMRSTSLDDAKEHREKFNRLLQDADVFFANKRPGFLNKHGLDAETLCEQKPGLIHATVVLHGEKGPWSNRPGFDEIGATVSGLFTIEGSATRPKQPPIVPICDNVVAWLGTTGILAALRRRAIEGGSYRVTVSLTRTVLWLLSLGIFDKAYARATAGSSDEHAYIAPDLFTAETPLGTYQGMTDQIVRSRTPGSFRTVLVPRGSSKPEWLAR